MKRKKSGAIEWLEFELLSGIEGLRHGVFLRHGGVSEVPYDSLSAGWGSKDDPERIKKNLRLMRETLQIPVLKSAFQVHGNECALVDSSYQMQNCDGLLTREKNLGLAVGHADCQAAIFYDPATHSLANVHCGWRGNVQNIYAVAIEKMHKEFGSLPQDLLVCISPSLGPDASEFKNYKTELPESFYPFQFKPTYFNLWEISRWQLLQAGILPEHIEIAGICTFSNPQDYFSYRREKDSGRHATIAALL